jgi:transcriptional regulator with XRE-family HTH domain
VRPVLKAERKYARISFLANSSRVPLRDDPGRKMRSVRERLRLKYRDVEQASRRIATEHGSHDFLIGLSRLADIENKGTVPTIYRLYSLCAIYGLDFVTALRWYGISLDRLAPDSARLALDETRPVDFQHTHVPEIHVPSDLEAAIDPRKTSYLTRHLRRWGKLPAALLNSLDLRRQRYGLIGTDDWSMYPILPPGSFIQVDETRRRIARDGWLHEYERPIYFLEHRGGYRCGWCTQKKGLLVVESHPLSQVPIEIFRYPGEAEVVGQVVGLAMRLDQARRRHTRS